MVGRLQVPPAVKKGDPFEIKVLVQHPMETGYRRDLNGQAIPMHIVNRLACKVNGREVFSAEFGTGIAANPYVAFFAVADESGKVEVEWSDDTGDRGSLSAALVVS
jgi:sulfur-oxidizing protein SoxZ